MNVGAKPPEKSAEWEWPLVQLLRVGRKAESDTIYGRGCLPHEWREPRIAIVGSRNPSEAALALASDLGRDLASLGFCIVSGGAIGIDSAVHRGVLDANGQTVVVLPTPLSKPHPARNHHLFRRVTERGAVISEHASQTPFHKGAFVTRNRLIAALSQAVIVVQAADASGSLATASYARNMGIDVWSVTWPPFEVAGSGNLTLLEQGAFVFRSAEQVAERYGVKSKQPAAEGAGQQQLLPLGEQGLTSPIELHLMSQLTRPRHIDELTSDQFDVRHCLGTLVELQVRGLVVHTAAGWISASYAR